MAIRWGSALTGVGLAVAVLAPAPPAASGPAVGSAVGPGVGSESTRPAVAALTATPSSAATSPPSGAVFGWGSDTWGQVGDGTSGQGTPTPVATPQALSGAGGASFTSVAAGGAFSVGLTAAGQVQTWGADFVGQLGNGSTSPTPTPTAITVPGGPVAAVAAGSGFALALTRGGQLDAWGANLFGQLGNGTTTSSDTPVAVSVPAGVTFTAIAAGGDHALALASTGTVYAWGANGDGQLGDGTTTSRDTPVAVPAPAGTSFTAIAAGTSHSLALTSTGGVEAWGFDASGQLGDGSWTDSDTMVAAALPAGTDVTSIAAGGAQSLALTSQGGVLAWGSDVFGQVATALVNSLPVDSALPVAPSGLPAQIPFVAVAAGQATSYAVTANGTLWDWGADDDGQLGDGTPTLAAVVPEPLAALPAGALLADVASGADASSVFVISRQNQTVTLPSVATQTYGDPPLVIRPTASSGLPVTLTASGACWGSLSGVTLSAGGTCTLVATQEGSRSYYPATATTSFTVLPAVLAVNAVSRTVVVGEPIPTLGASLSGFVNHDNPSDVSGSASCTTTATTASPVGTYPITCTVGTLSAAGYRFVVGRAGVLTIVSSSPATSGYALLGADGSIWSYTRTASGPTLLPSFGSVSGGFLTAPVVGGAFVTGHRGYWMAAADGGVFAFGSAGFYGSLAGARPSSPVVGMAATPDSRGYWLVEADGTVTAFGDATFYGSWTSATAGGSVVGMAATTDGGGYWLVSSSGAVTTFGDAGFFGSTGGVLALDPVVGIAATPDGGGYWLTTHDGVVYAFGDAPFHGSVRYVILNAPVVGVTSTVGGHGYWLAGADGGVFAFGRAALDGTADDHVAPIVGIL